MPGCGLPGQGKSQSQAPQLISVVPSSMCPTRVGTAASTAMVKARKKNRRAVLCYTGGHNLATTQSDSQQPLFSSALETLAFLGGQEGCPLSTQCAARCRQHSHRTLC